MTCSPFLNFEQSHWVRISATAVNSPPSEQKCWWQIRRHVEFQKSMAQTMAPSRIHLRRDGRNCTDSPGHLHSNAIEF
jgi:hypothetical protein